MYKFVVQLIVWMESYAVFPFVFSPFRRRYCSSQVLRASFFSCSFVVLQLFFGGWLKNNWRNAGKRLNIRTTLQYPRWDPGVTTNGVGKNNLRSESWNWVKKWSCSWKNVDSKKNVIFASGHCLLCKVAMDWLLNTLQWKQLLKDSQRLKNLSQNRVI